MRVGYSQPMTRKGSLTQEEHELKRMGVETVFIDAYTSREVWQQDSQLKQLLAYCQPGDVVVVLSLDRVTRSYRIWLDILAEFERRELELEVQLDPGLKRDQWQSILNWCYSNEQALESRVKVKGIGQESTEESRRYRGFTLDKSGRQVYWHVFTDLMMGQQLRKTAKKYEVSEGTVYRIKGDVSKVKQGVLLAGTFLVTIVSMGIARQYSDNFFLQIVIGAVATVGILYFTYSDMESDT